MFRLLTSLCLYGPELKRTHEKDLDNLEKSLKQTETSLSVRPFSRSQLEPACAINNRPESPPHQNKILPLSTENEALYKKLKEEEESSKHIPTEKNVVGSISFSLTA